MEHCGKLLDLSRSESVQVLAPGKGRSLQALGLWFSLQKQHGAGHSWHKGRKESGSWGQTATRLHLQDVQCFSPAWCSYL